MFKHSTVRTQLRVSFSFIIVVFLICAAAVGWLLQAHQAATVVLKEKGLPDVIAVDDMALAVSEVQQFLTDVSATHDKGAFEEAAASAKRFRDHVASFKAQAESAHDEAQSRELATLSNDFDVFWQVGERMAHTYLAKGIEAGNALMKGQGSEAGFDQRSEDLLKNLEAFRGPRLEAALKSASDLHSASSRAQWMLWAGVLCAAVLAVVVSTVVVNHLHRLLGGDPAQAADLARRVGAGDLIAASGGTEASADSVLSQLRGMQSSLAQVVRQVMDGSSGVAMASAQIAAGNADLSARTANQAAALQEAAASMSHLSATVGHNVKDAEEARRLVDDSCTTAERSGTEVSQVIGTMAEIEQASRKMSDIIGVIDGIAFQTNILALNAAVEAARAGEQGRGFAVVASEVRSLAGRSAAAAKDIRQLIQTNMERVDLGMQQVRGAGLSVDGVVERMKQASECAARIHAASVAQGEGIDSAARAVTGMDDLTQQNSALVEQTAAAAVQLNEQAQRLVASVRTFRLEEPVH
jgi:methyl-accepting chemotaxis protein